MNTRRRTRGMGNMLTTIPGYSLVTPMTNYEASTGMRGLHRANGLGDTVVPTSATTATVNGTASDVAAETSGFVSDLTAFVSAHPIGSSVLVFAIMKVLK